MSKNSNVYKGLVWVGLISAGLNLNACGTSTFGGGTISGSDGTPITTSTPPPTAITPDPDNFLITWFSACSNSKTTPPVAGANEVVLSGKGPHHLSSKILENPANMRFVGEVCGVQSMPRDIIFVVDVSGSMGPNDRGIAGGRGNDPVDNNGTCGRRKAIEAVVNSAGENGLARFGVVTFNDYLSVSSKSMQGSLSALTNDLLNGSGRTNISDILCANFYGTNYDVALQGAETLFASGRANALKEIYFISDGTPDPPSAHGKVVAERLKTTGVNVGGRNSLVTIVTTMLGLEDDSIMRNFIASKDNTGEPMHSKVDRASQLADTLKAMSQNSLEDGSIVYGETGSKSTKTISLKTFLKSANFQSDFIALDPKEIRGGIDMVIEFKDKGSNSETKSGSIVWD